MKEKMKEFLAWFGPLVGNFIAWWFITLLPVHPMITFVLVFASGSLMLYGMWYFTRAVDKDKAAQSKS
jgi:hypothetical protein